MRRRVPEVPGGAPCYELQEPRQELCSCLSRRHGESRGTSGGRRFAGRVGFRIAGIRTTCTVSPPACPVSGRKITGFAITVRRCHRSDRGRRQEQLHHASAGSTFRRASSASLFLIPTFTNLTEPAVRDARRLMRAAECSAAALGLSDAAKSVGAGPLRAGRCKSTREDARLWRLPAPLGGRALAA